MRIRHTIAASAIALATLGMSAANAATNLIADGNFNNPLASGDFQTFSVGDTFGGTNGTDWNVIGSVNSSVTVYGPPGVDEIGNYWNGPTADTGSVDIDGDAPGGISQDISTVIGKAYNVRFDLSGNPDGPPVIKELLVTAGSAIYPFSYTLPGGTNGNHNLVYQPQWFSFVATATTTDIEFQSNDNASPWGPVVADVSVSAVPEPATWAMLLLGFGAIGWTLRGSRKQALAVTA